MPPTLLIVPIKQKDEVESLGARRGGTERQWLVPEGRDLAPFEAWLHAVDELAPTFDPACSTTFRQRSRPAASDDPLSRLTRERSSYGG
jgi:hypothetical protein